MTHEQKPESAEFRTREAQHSQLGEALSDEVSDEKAVERWYAYALKHILEAEARGAAEQRRKDAEGVMPVGRVTGHWADGTPMFDGWDTDKPLPLGAFVYDRPANVAALEDRVKELEGALVKVSETDNLGAKPDYHRCPVDQLAFELAWMCDEAELSANDLVIVNREKLKTIARRVVARAAIREGGEHG